MGEIAGNQVQIRIGGTPIEFIDETVITEDNRVYSIQDTNKNIFDYNTPIIVTGTDESFLIDYPNGKVIFKEAKVRDITISGNYITTSLCAYAHSYSLSVSADLLDVTRFVDIARRRIGGLKTASGDLSTWDVLDDFFIENLTSGNPVFIDIQKPNKNTRLWVLLNGEELSSAISGVQDKKVSFESVGIF